MAKRNRFIHRWSSLTVFAFSFFGIVLVASAILALGSHLTGGAQAFQEVLSRSAPWLFIWRILLYTALGALWRYLMRPRVLERLAHDSDGGEAGRNVLPRLEKKCLIAITLFEAYNLFMWWEGQP